VKRSTRTQALRTPAALALAAALATSAGAHDVLLEAGPSLTASSADNPRSGNLQVHLEATLEASEAVALFGSVQYTRDFGTRTAATASGGSDLFLLGGGASWTPDEHWMTLVALTAALPALQRNATTVTDAAGQSLDVVVDSRSWSLGGLWVGGFATAGGGPLESTVDVAAGLTRYDVFQQLELGTAPRAEALRTACQAPRASRSAVCKLVAGTATPLLQARLGAGYTLTVDRRTDLGLALDGYLYDQDPTQVGYFSLVALGRAELGSGVQVLPLAFSVKPSVVHRLGQLTVRLAYQLGLHVGGQGATHTLSGKVTWKATPDLRLWVALTGQVDASQGRLQDPGATAVLGALWEW
jgi:hypothetical protein